jgi:recombination protein RecA
MKRPTGIDALIQNINQTLRGADGGISLYSHIQALEVGARELISSGNLAIDYVLGGGFPVHRTSEIFGEYSSGKSLICHEVLANVIEQGGYGALFDVEAAYDERFGERIGIDHHRLFYSQPDTVETLFEMVEALLTQFRKERPNDLLCIVWDSLAASSTKHEMAEPDKRDMTKAAVIGAGLRRVTRIVAKQRAMFIVVNQVREKIGVFFGSPETTPGGKALPFHASIRLRLKQGSLYKGHPVKILENGVPIGTRIVVDCVKNKMAPPYKRCEAIISFQHGFVKHSGLAYLLRDEGRIAVKGEKKKDEKSSGKEVFSYNGESFQWFEIEPVLKKHPDLLKIGE